VTITASATATSAGSDDASGTLRIHTDKVALYNLNIRNDHGSGVQAIALSNYGNEVGVYACQLVGYQVRNGGASVWKWRLISDEQDTLLTEQGLHVYLQSYIQGAVDFIFGQRSRFPPKTTRTWHSSRSSGQAYFEGNVIAISGPGCITASGRSSADAGICARHLISSVDRNPDAPLRPLQPEHYPARVGRGLWHVRQHLPGPPLV
jgi:pectinesterase